MAALGQSRQVFEILSKSLGMVPVVGENLKSAAELASKICEEIETIQENREGYERLGAQVRELLLAISGVVDQEKDHEGKLTARKPHVENLKRVLGEIQITIHERVPSRPPHSKTSLRVFASVRRALSDTKNMSADKDKIRNMERKLRDVMDRFGVTSLMLTNMNIERVLARMSELAEAQDVTKEHAERLEQVQAERSLRLEEAQQKFQRDADTALLDTLRPVSAAAWTSLPTCTPSTRVSVLHEIESWAETSHGPCVFWLNGLAGTGKSTIAASVCERLDEKQLLGASFFISRQQANTRDASNIVRSIAHGLASRNRLITEALCATLRDSSVSVSRSLDKQISDFVTRPARALDVETTLVIVLDALDECLLDVRGRPGGELVLVLVQQLLSLSGRLKLFITSRNELPIQQMFNQLAETAKQRVTKLHDLDEATVQTDIQTYLAQSFQTLRYDRCSELPLTDWPRDGDLQKLVHQSGLLFIYAATVVRFLFSPRHSPPERLAQLLGYQQSSSTTSPHQHLDELYMGILQDAVGMSENENDTYLYERLHAVVAVIVLAQSPVPVDALAILSGVKLNGVRIVLRYLTSLLLVNADEEPVRIFHPSFPDFVTDASRCTVESLRVNPPVDHGVLASQCLSILNQTLHYDICDIQNPALDNKKVPDLDRRLRNKVPSWNAVRYACCFWTRHLVKCDKPSSDLLEMLDDFCRKHIFHWLEVLSLIEYLLSLEGDLLQVIEWCKMHALNSREHAFPAADLLYDTVRTLQAYYIPMRSHALQIYHSAFVTMPKCSLQQILAQGDMPSSLSKLISPRASHWGPSARILEGHGGAVMCVAFSRDGTRIASGSGDGNVRIWNAVTFEEVGKLEGHQDWIYSVAFSPDDTHIASGSEDCTVRIWDAVSFEELAKLEGHQGLIRSVAFSPDGRHIVSGSEDGTARLWNAVSFGELAKLEGHQDMIRAVALLPDGTHIASGSDNQAVHICSVAFSPDGTHIAFGSGDDTVRIWNAVTFEELAKLKNKQCHYSSVAYSPDGTRVASGAYDCVRIWDTVSFEELAMLGTHQAGVTSVAFSPDGTHFACGSHDNTVRIWNAVTFEESAKLENHQGAVFSVAFSPDSTHIASGANDGTMRIWNAVRSEEPVKLKGHRDGITSVAFSPDGTHIASGADDCTVRIWNAVTLEELAKLEGHLSWLTSVAFSPDGTHIASSSHDRTMRIWNAVTFEELTKFEGYQAYVTSVAFSPDGKHIASGADDCTVRIWNTVTFEELTRLGGHQDVVSSVVFSPDGKLIASGLEDGTVHIWNAVIFEELASLEGHQRAIISVTFSPDSTIISSRDDIGARCAWTCSTFNNRNLALKCHIENNTPDIWHAVEPPSLGFIDDIPGFTEIALSDSGWLQSGADPSLWLPVERRGSAVTSYARNVAVGGYSGAVTVLELPARSHMSM